MLTAAQARPVWSEPCTRTSGALGQHVPLLRGAIASLPRPTAVHSSTSCAYSTTCPAALWLDIKARMRSFISARRAAAPSSSGEEVTTRSVGPPTDINGRPCTSDSCRTRRSVWCTSSPHWRISRGGGCEGAVIVFVEQSCRGAGLSRSYEVQFGIGDVGTPASAEGYSALYSGPLPSGRIQRRTRRLDRSDAAGARGASVRPVKDVSALWCTWVDLWWVSANLVETRRRRPRWGRFRRHGACSMLRRLRQAPLGPASPRAGPSLRLGALKVRSHGSTGGGRRVPMRANEVSKGCSSRRSLHRRRSEGAADAVQVRLRAPPKRRFWVKHQLNRKLLCVLPLRPGEAARYPGQRQARSRFRGT